MNDQPEWNSIEPSSSIQKWTNFLHAEAKRLFNQDGTHGNILFSFSKDNGIVSVNLVPPNTDNDQLNEGIINAINEYQLFGVVLIGETWTYTFKDKDHTAFQILDGEMKVSDLHKDDKKEALMVKMETRNGDCLLYLDEIIRSENGHSLKETAICKTIQKMWFK